MHLDDIERSIENKTNKNMFLYMWLSDNYERLNLGKLSILFWIVTQIFLLLPRMQ